MATRVTPARYELLLTRSQKLAVVLPFILVLVVRWCSISSRQIPRWKSGDTERQGTESRLDIQRG
jgi:hypothetical protein